MRIFLACSESACNTEEKDDFYKKNKPLYLLQTFFSGEKKCKEALDIVGRENFLLDSGAFSYMSGAKCTKESLLEYLDRYIEFINKYNIKYFFELDVDTIFGIEFVEKMREKLESKTHKKCIPVWHKSRGIDYWKKMCDEYEYIAIGGLVFHVKKREWPLIKKMVDYAYLKGVKVHGLGFTKTRILENEKWHFYSVDSSSWLSSSTRGQNASYFNGRYIQNKQINKKNRKVDIVKLSGFNFKEWLKYQKYMDKKGW